MTSTTLQQRSSRASARSWKADSLEGAVWLACAAGIALVVNSGGMQIIEPLDYLYSAGRVFAIVAAVLMMMQMLLVSRAPWIERVLGHDSTTEKHTRWGKVAFVVMALHVLLITLMTGRYDGENLVAQLWTFFQGPWFMTWAVVAFVVFMVVVGTSLVIVRSRWKYENWHTVHLFVYVAIVFAIPHQFLEGSTFRSMGAAWWFWFSLYVITVGSFVIYRVAVPLVRLSRHGLRVASVNKHDDGSVSITMTGSNVAKLGAKPGQFMLWRFMQPGLMREAHPYSLSSAATSDSLRITVKPSGDYSTKLGDVKVGTRVLAEGPLGIFHHDTRAGHGLVLVAAGIGITPIRAMLEEHDASEPCTVIIRARNATETPLVDEVRELAKQRGAMLHVLMGSRGQGWAPAEAETTLGALVDDLAGSDVYVCGPVAWAEQVERDARAAGVPANAVHRERFGW